MIAKLVVPVVLWTLRPPSAARRKATPSN